MKLKALRLPNTARSFCAFFATALIAVTLGAYSKAQDVKQTVGGRRNLPIEAKSMNKNTSPFRAINPPGPQIPGISQAVMIESGRMLLLSGHVPFDQHGRIVGGDVATQLDQVFANLDRTLRAAGGDLSNLARITIYVRDYDAAVLPPIRAVRDKWIDTACPPASSLIGVSALAFPGLLVEVDGIAVMPSAGE